MDRLLVGFWYAIATGNDFESHDGITEEGLYQKIFRYSLRPLGNHLPVGIQPPVPRGLANKL